MDENARYLSILEIASLNKWPRQFNATGSDIVDDIIRFINEIENAEQASLAIDILRQYIIIKDYHEHTISIVKKVYAKFSKQQERLILAPVHDEKSSLIKSSPSFCYDVMTQLNPRDFGSVEIFLPPYERMGSLVGQNILVFDDFVGSGSQFRKFSRHIQASFGAEKGRIYLFCIASMPHRHPRILQECQEVETELSSIQILKYLAKIDPSRDVYGLYDALESTLSIRPFYKRGYGRSEAAISMKRTPNNTLPIFWSTIRKGGKSWPAPFPRY
ncbi:phosphoribosyltransferase-like protein [Hansschlegelia sp. KR7-227]|uniref:phosphoribosyltransferase-like protein n=1 Tax=Hansschlegelia sp. KR7-227 TaxID=3400914 RepID=UPI003C07E2DA